MSFLAHKRQAVPLVELAVTRCGQNLDRDGKRRTCPVFGSSVRPSGNGRDRLQSASVADVRSSGQTADLPKVVIS
jgi:hypothetical protein